MKTKIIETISFIDNFTIKNNKLCSFKDQIISYNSNNLHIPDKLLDIFPFKDGFILILHCGNVLILSDFLVIMKSIFIDDFILDCKFYSTYKPKNQFKSEFDDKIIKTTEFKEKGDLNNNQKCKNKIKSYDVKNNSNNIILNDYKDNINPQENLDDYVDLNNSKKMKKMFNFKKTIELPENKIFTKKSNDNIIFDKKSSKLLNFTNDKIYILGINYFTELNIYTEEMKKVKNKKFMKFCKGEKIFFADKNGNIIHNSKKIYSHHNSIIKMEIYKNLYTMCSEKLIIYDWKKMFIISVIDKCLGLTKNLYYTERNIYFSDREYGNRENFLVIKNIGDRFFGSNKSSVFEIIISN
ncbi:hypothetical protein DMUE_3239 [Dictyocoela muelleri]|nr:hypothetical protein DMUE_3239 [Dictyocoela muelleri]